MLIDAYNFEYCCLYFQVAFFAHDNTTSGRLNFRTDIDSIVSLIVLMLARVPLGSRSGQKQVLFFSTTKKSLSSSALDCGIVKIKRATFFNFLNQQILYRFFKFPI